MALLRPFPLRISEALRDRVEALVPRIAAAQPAHRITFAAVLRMAVTRGVSVLEREFPG